MRWASCASETSVLASHHAWFAARSRGASRAVISSTRAWPSGIRAVYGYRPRLRSGR